jgi:hypothetical protein
MSQIFTLVTPSLPESSRAKEFPCLHSPFQRFGKPKEKRMIDARHLLTAMRKVSLYLVARAHMMLHQSPSAIW